jgi:uroporphyrinogen-III synthase
MSARPLTGYTIGVTAARRSEELAALLERRGARVVSAPAIRIAPLADDAGLLAATRACIALPPDFAVVTTGIGFRGWVEAADGWALGRDLRLALSSGRLVARGPKARGALRATGLRETWSPSSESMDEVLRCLLDTGVDGARVAVQLHGDPMTEFVAALRDAGADVVTVPVYRWLPPADVRPLRRLVEAVAAAKVDAVVFTSAPAVRGMLACASEQQVHDGVLNAMRTTVAAACIGPLCAAPLERAGVATVWPRRGRLGDLVRLVVEELPRRQCALPVNGRLLELRGRGVVLDGSFVEVPPVPLAVLRALAARPGRVLSRAELLAALPGPGGNEHVVEMAVSRLRRLTREPHLVRTVVQRGYQMRLDS